MKTDTYISSELVTSADNQKAMIFFFFLKSKYKKSVFYGYTPEKLASLTDVSPNTVRKYVGWLKMQRYARILTAKDKTKRNLWLISTRKIKGNERLVLVDTRAWTTWKQFENRVYAQIIKDNLIKQAFHYEMKGFVSGTIKEKISVRSLRKYLRTYGKNTKETETKPVSSIRQIARLFNRSQGWTQNLLSRLERMKYITRKEQRELLVYGFVPPEFEPTGYVYYNQRRNAMILHNGSLITVKY
jgi:hypothetical protein